MKPYNINSTYTAPNELYSNDINLVIYKSIKQLIVEINDGNGNETTYQKKMIISELIKYITCKDLLFPTIQYLRKLGLFKILNKQLLDWQNRFFNDTLFSIEQYTRIDAIIYGTILEYETQLIFHNKLLNGIVPELKFKVIGDFLYHNMEEINNELKRKKTIGIYEQTKKYSPKTQNRIFEKIINYLNEINYKNGGDYFKEEISFLSKARENISYSKIIGAKIIIENHPFKDDQTLDFFLNYFKKHIVEPYPDISYLFQRMKRKNLIVEIGHITFMNWLKENDLINVTSHDYLVSKGAFRTEKKSFSIHRDNDYNNLYKEIFID